MSRTRPTAERLARIRASLPGGIVVSADSARLLFAEIEALTAERDALRDELGTEHAEWLEIQDTLEAAEVALGAQTLRGSYLRHVRAERDAAVARTEKLETELAMLRTTRTATECAEAIEHVKSLVGAMGDPLGCCPGDQTGHHSRDCVMLAADAFLARHDGAKTGGASREPSSGGADAAWRDLARAVFVAAEARLWAGPRCCHASDGEHVDCSKPATWSDDCDEWCDAHKPAGAYELPWAAEERALHEAVAALRAARKAGVA